ncbi:MULTISPECIES: hypothetical protein [Aerosakkonema]|uniref:hypothetical protein n=1 Tax=Aerosakkonema TaxID=1246629 RepID=UPI0035B9B0D2
MSSHNEDQIERRLREIEAEISIQHIPRTPKPQQPNRWQLAIAKMNKVAKVAVFAATGLISVWVFSTAVSFISIVIGLLITAGVGYVGYKLFLNRDNYR